MSRSYKHTPSSRSIKHKTLKRYSNHIVRRLPIDELPLKGKMYKKVYNSYEICDYQTVGISFEQYWDSLVKSWHKWGKYGVPYPDREKAYKDYCRWFLRK